MYISIHNNTIAHVFPGTQVPSPVPQTGYRRASGYRRGSRLLYSALPEGHSRIVKHCIMTTNGVGSGGWGSSRRPGPRERASEGW